MIRLRVQIPTTRGGRVFEGVCRYTYIDRLVAVLEQLIRLVGEDAFEIQLGAVVGYVHVDAGFRDEVTAVVGQPSDPMFDDDSTLGSCSGFVISRVSAGSE